MSVLSEPVARPGSLGFATDLALLRLQGSTVEEHADHLVVRTPANPTYHWGNFVILDRAPSRGSLARALEVFRMAHPGAAHVAIGFDDARATVDADEATSLGVDLEHDVVLATHQIAEPEQVAGIRVQRVSPADDAAWEALVDLEVEAFGGQDPEGHRVFARRRLAGHRSLVAAGHGAWCAAYTPEDQPVAGLGIFAVGEGRARYQDVVTRPGFRRRGIAGALVRYAGRHALHSLGASTLVIVADHQGPAIGLYRAAGFTDHQVQWALYRSGEPRSGTG